MKSVKNSLVLGLLLAASGTTTRAGRFRLGPLKMRVTWFLILAALLPAVSAVAQTYAVEWHKIAGGGGTSDDGTYEISGTIGQHEAGPENSDGAFAVTGGFWVVPIRANRAPVAFDRLAAVVLGHTVTVQILGGKHSPVDPDGDGLRLLGVGDVTSGLASHTASNVIYAATGSPGTNTFTYTVADDLGSLVTRTVTVLVDVNTSGYNLLSTTASAGYARLTYLGIPGYRYALEVAHALPTTNWTPVLTNQALANGLLSFTNLISLPPTNDFYRTRHVP